MHARSIAVSIATIIAAASSPYAAAQSVGRGRPVAETKFAFVSGGVEGQGQQTARDGAAPQGVQALKVDLFTTKDFYEDTNLWSDPRYFRCNSPSTLEGMWGGGAAGSPKPIGANPPASASWGRCDVDYPRDGDRFALSVQDRARALRGAARGDQSEGRAHRLHA